AADEVHSEIVEQCERHWTNDWNTVLHIRYETRIAAGIDNALHRNRHGDLPLPRIGGIAGNRRTIGIHQWDINLRRNENKRRQCAQIEAAKIGVAAQIEALKWRSHAAAIS